MFCVLTSILLRDRIAVFFFGFVLFCAVERQSALLPVRGSYE